MHGDTDECSSVSFPCPQLLQEISPHSGLGLQENIGSRHGEPLPHLLPSAVSPSSCGSFSSCEHFALSELCLPVCHQCGCWAHHLWHIWWGKRWEGGWEGLGFEGCVLEILSITRSSVFTPSLPMAALHTFLSFALRTWQPEINGFFSPSWGISEGSAHWVFWALNWGIWSDGENMWKIMGWNKCLHVWI